MIEKPAYVERIYIRATPDQVWQGLTDPDFTRQYFFNGRVSSDWRAGSPITYVDAGDGSLQIEGAVLEADPPRRLVIRERFVWAPDVAADPVHRVEWVIEPTGKTCRLTVSYFEVAVDCASMRSIEGGLPWMVSGLKTLLETGEPLPPRPARTPVA